MHRHLLLISVAHTLLAGIVACGGGADQLDFEQFEAGVYRELETGIYIVDGDIPIENKESLREFFEALVLQEQNLRTQTQGLAVHRTSGADDVWSTASKCMITYCVSTTFGSNYTAVVNAMRAATEAWQGSANVYFEHRASEDGSCTSSNNAVVFDVSPTTNQPYNARAFFPSFARTSRNILINSTAFGAIAPRTLTGILAHEVGHTLGFRHEHTRPEAASCFEDNNWRGVTPYDSGSVMHYAQCNGTNLGDYALTARDREGARSLYGLPEPAAPAGTVRLVSWWSPGRLDNFVTSHPGWRGCVGATRSPDYRFVRTEGFALDPAAPQPAGTIRLPAWYSPGRGDNYLTSHSSWQLQPGDSLTRMPDYGYVRLEGYAFSPTSPQPAGTVALYSWWDANRGDNWATTQHQAAGASGSPLTPNYNFSRLEGYIYP